MNDAKPRYEMPKAVPVAEFAEAIGEGPKCPGGKAGFSAKCPGGDNGWSFEEPS